MREEILSDEFLIDAIAGKAMWALERLYQRYSGRFYALSYRMTADHMASEEMVQDAFNSIWQSAATYTPQKGAVRSWLFSIIYHHTLNYLRSERRNTLLQQVPWQECEAYERFALSDVWEEVWNSIQSAELHECLTQLPSEQRKMIELAYFNGLTHSEIAQHCQIPLGTVKARIRLGVLHLRQVLEQRGDREKRSISHIAGAGASSKQSATVLVQAAECGCATGYLLCREEGCHCFGYTEWEHLLAQIDVFEFLGMAGNLTARKEKRGHDHAYWYAYTWGSAGRRKAYIGLPAELTLTRLETMAKKLHEGREG